MNYRGILCLFGLKIILFGSCINATSEIRNSDQVKTNPGNNADSVYSDINEQQLGDILSKYTAMYKTPVRIDTGIYSNGKSYRIKLRHFCLMDNGLTLPEKYVSFYGLKEFQTHSFESKLEVCEADSLIMSKVITTNTFNEQLFEALDKYGVLLNPDLTFTTNGVLINYDISIPLTDIGIRSGVLIDYLNRDMKIIRGHDGSADTLNPN